MCAIAYAKTDHVSKVLFCTGEYTHFQDPDSEVVKKTVNVVKQLFKPCKNSCRCACVCGFCASIILMEESDKMNFHCTGTATKNILPEEFRIKKTSQEFKDVARGDWKFHACEYVTRADGLSKKHGLV